MDTDSSVFMTEAKSVRSIWPVNRAIQFAVDFFEPMLLQELAVTCTLVTGANSFYQMKIVHPHETGAPSAPSPESGAALSARSSAGCPGAGQGSQRTRTDFGRGSVAGDVHRAYGQGFQLAFKAATRLPWGAGLIMGG